MFVSKKKYKALAVKVGVLLIENDELKRALSKATHPSNVAKKATAKKAPSKKATTTKKKEGK